MTKHKTEDYKISAVKYYLNNDKVKIYTPCNRQTLKFPFILYQKVRF